MSGGQQASLFGDDLPPRAPPVTADGKVITLYDDQHVLLRQILALYVPAGRFDLDVTYATGGFYRDGVPEPRLKFSNAPTAADVQYADFGALPLPDSSVTSTVFDPSFLHQSGRASRMAARFDSCPRATDIRAEYARGMAEQWRVLVPEGILVVKCQDETESSKQQRNHIAVYLAALDLGFVDRDLLQCWNDKKMLGHNWARQRSAWKVNTFWWVFEKPRPRRTGRSQ